MNNFYIGSSQQWWVLIVHLMLPALGASMLTWRVSFFTPHLSWTHWPIMNQFSESQILSQVFNLFLLINLLQQLSFPKDTNHLQSVTLKCPEIIKTNARCVPVCFPLFKFTPCKYFVRGLIRHSLLYVPINFRRQCRMCLIN